MLHTDTWSRPGRTALALVLALGSSVLVGSRAPRAGAAPPAVGAEARRVRPMRPVPAPAPMRVTAAPDSTSPRGGAARPAHPSVAAPTPPKRPAGTSPKTRGTVRATLVSVMQLPHETLVVDLPHDGRVRKAEARKLARFFRCRRTGRWRAMAPGVLALLADVASRYPGRVIEVVSGYRARPYGVRRSRHFRGQAIDLRVRGVKLADLRDAMWVSHPRIGVGWYPRDGFIHIDTRPAKAKAAWTTTGKGKSRSRPPWARRALAQAAHAEAEGPARAPVASASAPNAAR